MKTLVWVGSEVGPTFTSEKLSQDYDFSSGPVEVDDGGALELIRLVGRNLQDVSEFEALGISSVPSEVDYFNGVAVAKVGLNDAITRPTNFGIRFTAPVASNDASLSTDLKIAGGLYLRTGAIVFKDVAGESVINTSWAADDELIVTVNADGVNVQVGCVDGISKNVKEIVAPTKYLTSSVCAVNFADVATASVTCSGATYAKTKDSTIKREGATTLKIENQTSGGTLNTTYNVNIARTSAPVCTIVFYIPDYKKVNGVALRVSVGDTAFTNYYSYAYPVGPSGETFTQFNGWHAITISESDWVATGSPSWASGIKSIRLVQPNPSGVTGGIVYYDSIHFDVNSTPVLMIHCDDVTRTWYTEARSILNANNIKSCLAVAADWVANASYMTTAMLHEMQDEGHEIVVHSTNRIGSAYQLTTVEAALADIAYNRSFVTNEFGASGARFFVFANGQYWISDRAETGVIDGMQAAGICSARITDTLNKNRSETHGLLVQNLFLLNEIGPWSSDTVATLNGRIDALIARGDMGIEVYHGPFPDIAGFQQHMEYIAAKVAAGELRVMTWSQWYDGLRDQGTVLGMPKYASTTIPAWALPAGVQFARYSKIVDANTITKTFPA